MGATTILLYGRTNSGKSTQIGVLAEDVYKRTGKRTRLYTADKGGYGPVAPYVDLGIIEVVEIGDTSPWIFLNKAVKGMIRDASGKWVLDKQANSMIGFYAFESAHGIAKLLKLDMERQAALGISVGGDTNTSFDIKGDGETLKIGTTKGYQKFSIPQDRIWQEMLESHKLPAEYVLWTAGLSKDDDEVSTNKVAGPDVIGRALTGTLSMDFNLTLRMDVMAASGTKEERHILYLGNHQDMNSGNAVALGNIRRPLDAKKLENLTVEPADIAKAIRLVQTDAAKEAKEVIKRRLGLKVDNVSQLSVAQSTTTVTKTA